MIKQISLGRIALALTLIVVGGWLSFSLAVSGVTRVRNPQAALMFLPRESIALAGRADQLLLANPVTPSPTVAQMARAALIQQALNPKALRILGYVAEIRGDKARALRFIETAAHLSHREPGAQLWLIEFYAQKNNNSAALAHYDILLTTKPETQALLFPRLSNAIADPPIRAALRPYLNRDAPWASIFLWHVINTDKDLSKVVSLIAENGGFPQKKMGTEVSRDLEGALIARLISEGRFEDARRIYDLVPGAMPTLLVNPNFSEHDRDARFGAMSWQIVDEPNVGGAFTGKIGQGSPKLSIFANSATTRTAARRLLYLRPGGYRINVKFAHFESDEGGYIQLQMRCPTSTIEEPLWTFTVDPKRGQGQFYVPASCPVQWLNIVASSGEGQMGLEATIASLVID